MTDGAERVLAGRYRLLRQLGEGGMGAVWEAEHLSLRSPVAVKLIDKSMAANEEMRARFMREARAAASLRSPHVVQILDHGVDGDTPFIAMELLEGESLGARLARLGTLTPAKTAQVITHVARAVARAHEAGIVHRDLKPDNIFLVRNDDEELAKVLDFGIAKGPATGTLAVASTHTGAMLGTPFYMSPEQAGASKLIDHTTDIWAVGIIAYECLLGTRPFGGDTVGELVLAICSQPLPVPSSVGPVPAGFDAWFARACARNPAARFGSVKECAAALRRVCGVPEAANDESEPSGSHRVQVRVGSDDLFATTGQVSAATRSAAESTPRRSTGLMTGVVLGIAGMVGASTWFLARQSETQVPVGSPSVESASSGLGVELEPPASSAAAEGVEAPIPSPTEPSAGVGPTTDGTATSDAVEGEPAGTAPAVKKVPPVQPRRPRVVPAPPPPPEPEARPEPPRAAPSPPKVDLGI